MKTVSIVGAGVSGLALAQSIKSNVEVQLLEKGAKPGGLIKCDVINGNLFHRVGGHVFNAKNKDVHNWFWTFFDQEKEFIKAKRNARIFMGGRLLGYPIENFLTELDRGLVTKVIDDLLHINRRGELPVSNNFEDFLKNSFGPTLYELYFNPYNSKIWNIDLSKVPLSWLEGKLPMPDLKQIITSNILKQEESTMVHSTFYYPKEGGSQFIADRLSKNLPIVYNSQVTSIVKKGDKFLVDGQYKSDSLVYTGDVRKLADIFITDSAEIKQALNEVRGLRSNGTSNLFCECDSNDISWLYIPENFTRAHRIIYTGNFSENNNKGTSRSTCVVEFSGKVEPEIMKEEIKKLPGNLSPLDFNYEPNSYVVQEHSSRAKIERLKQLLSVQGFHLLGRFAEWEYYNMDKAIEAALKLKDDLIK